MTSAAYAAAGWYDEHTLGYICVAAPPFRPGCAGDRSVNLEGRAAGDDE
jgi:hypothetical protein